MPASTWAGRRLGCLCWGALLTTVLLMVQEAVRQHEAVAIGVLEPGGVTRLGLAAKESVNLGLPGTMLIVLAQD